MRKVNLYFNAVEYLDNFIKDFCDISKEPMLVLSLFTIEDLIVNFLVKSKQLRICRDPRIYFLVGQLNG